MALRAMYKGFKKVLAPLIIHRPGELAIDQDALNAELNTVFYPRSEQAVTGVVNLFDINAPRTNSAGVTSTVSSSATASSLNIKNTEAATYKETDYIGLSFPKNTNLKVTFGVTVTSGKGRFYIDGSNDGTTWTSIASSDPITASGNFTVPFNTGNYSSYRIRWYCSFDVSAAGDITYTNIVIKSALDTSTTYVPFAMTNKELTDAISNISSGWDYSTSEVDTGQKWIDGRPIYCRVIALENAISATAGSWTSTGVSSAGVDVLLNISSAGDACTNLRGANKVSTTEEFHIQAYYGTVSVSTVIVYYLKTSNRAAAPEDVTPEEKPVKKTTRKKSTAKADTEKEGE